MKKTCLAILLALASFKKTDAQETSPLKVVSWNVEWYGSPFESPANDNLQEQNAKVILRWLNADVYGLVEIVDSSRLRRLTDSMGPQYAYVLSPFSSGNSTGTGTAWLNAQKLAFIYNKNVLTNVSARGMMRNSGPAYTAFASGRFPYMLSADVTKGSVTRRMNFILLHGKAGSTVSDYERRREAAKELKDTLDTYYSTATNLLIGDFNDALYGTICNSCGTILSSYDPIVKDSTDNDHYKSITLPLSIEGQSSMTSFPNVVDNHVISNEAAPSYVPGSAQIVTDVQNLVSNYANTTSDHYPVVSQYNLSGIITSIPNVSPTLLGISISPNPVQNQLTIAVSKQLMNVELQLIDGTGKLMKTEERKFIAANSAINWYLPSLSEGIYYLRVASREYQTVLKLVKVL